MFSIFRSTFKIGAVAVIAAGGILAYLYAEDFIFFLKPGAEWKYYTGAQQLKNNWHNDYHELLVMGEGAAPLGYSYNDIATLISARNMKALPFSGDSFDKYPAAYFARTFFVERAALSEGQTAITAFVSCDDGCIAYVNGEEIGRIRLPEGAVEDYSAEAIGKVTGYSALAIPVSLLRDGANDVAVEVHQQHPQSSDLKFDAFITPANPDFIAR